MSFDRGAYRADRACRCKGRGRLPASGGTPGALALSQCSPPSLGPMPKRKPESETALYAPVKRFLEAQGFAVKGEVCGCDLVALRGDEPPVVVIGELKLTFNLELVLQGVERSAACDEVWLAVRASCRAAAARTTGACASSAACSASVCSACSRPAASRCWSSRGRGSRVPTASAARGSSASTSGATAIRCRAASPRCRS